MGSILPCFWDRDPPLWLGGPWPARPPPVKYKPPCPLVLLEPRPPTASLPLLQPLGVGGEPGPHLLLILGNL